MSFGLRADSHQPRLYSKLTFEGATPCPLKISQPSHPCQGLPPVDTPHGVCRDYILQPCRPGAHECSLALAGRVQEGQDVQSLLLSKLDCLRSRPHIIIPACPAGNSRKHHALLHEQVSPRSSQTTNSPQIPPPGHTRGLGGLDGRVTRDCEPWSVLQVNKEEG